MKKITLMLLIFFSLLINLSASEKDVRPPAVAGQFYPADAKELSQSIDNVLSNVPDQSKLIGNARPVAIIVPHAGYVFSAQTAAYSFKLLENTNINTVIVIGNTHYFPINNGAMDFDKFFRTPLGDIPVNVTLAKDIMKRTPYLEENKSVHTPEHSIEVELPFLQKLCKNFSIVPILIGQIDLARCRSIGDAIAEAIKEQNILGNTMIVISTDMSHYPSWANANMVDGASLKSIEKFDPEALAASINNFENSKIPNEACVFCGKEAVYTGMYAAKALGADRAVVLHYANSGDVTGDKSRVVGYGAVALTMPKNKKTPSPDPKISKEKKMSDFSVSEKNQEELLKLARQSIENYLKTGKPAEIKLTDPELSKDSAVFVTLTSNHNLRGCIGTTAAQFPLYRAVSEYAIAAAAEDPRFYPLTLNELKDVRIEISVLSPMKRIKSPDEIKPKVDGVLVKRGYRSGLFLPQVWEQLPNKENFMGELCAQKAGLEPDAWKKGDVELYTFTVFAFEEK